MHYDNFLHHMSMHTTHPKGRSTNENGMAMLYGKGFLPASTMIVWLRTTIRSFTDPITGNKDISFVAYGKRAGDFQSLQELHEQHPNASSKSLMLAIVTELSGGGPTKMQWDVTDQQNTLQRINLRQPCYL